MNRNYFFPSMVAYNRTGKSCGIPSFCTAHPDVLRSIFNTYKETDFPVLIEATCNQVNQFGGYTGMRPKEFRDFISRLADDVGLDFHRVILGGDHLGPNPWKDENSAQAMKKAADLVQSYVEAGFTKIHLDASMPCADDGVLEPQQIAERAAFLCEVAEAATTRDSIYYVIGTEVPIPGGETETSNELDVTSTQSVTSVMDLHKAEFERRGLSAALSRIIAMVVQPGVDFSNTKITRFNASGVKPLAEAILEHDELIYEAHSTDYQHGEALSGLVDNHFGILKVGPELTFAYREAVVAMIHIVQWLMPSLKMDLIPEIRKAMVSEPVHWQGYIAEDAEREVMKIFGLSDRIRYYWLSQSVRENIKYLYEQFNQLELSHGLVSQYLGAQNISTKPPHQSNSDFIIEAKVGAVVRKYQSACVS